MKIIFDENLPKHIAIGMSHLDNNSEINHVLDYFPRGTSDIEILEFVGKQNYFLMTKDRRMRYNLAEKQALMNNKVGAFFLVGKTMRLWDIVKQVVNSWENIIQISEKENKPFIYTIRRSGKPSRIL